MKYVIIRDDDTNALTPVSCLEQLYRPFLDRKLPVCLATIPDVRSDVRLPNGDPEGFLVAAKGVKPGYYKIGSNPKLVGYLQANPDYEIVHHACHHDFVNGKPEFDNDDATDVAQRLEHGAECLREAGFADSGTFVAPYDRLTPASYLEVAKRFNVISTGWFERRRLPQGWLAGYVLHKLSRKKHWRREGTLLLTHPGCHLSYHRKLGEILPRIRASIAERQVTVLVTHWWEYFRTGDPDEPFIDVLHETAKYLASRSDLRVIKFSDAARLAPEEIG
jgi:predicted deacetylase